MKPDARGGNISGRRQDETLPKTKIKTQRVGLRPNIKKKRKTLRASWKALWWCTSMLALGPSKTFYLLFISFSLRKVFLIGYFTKYLISNNFQKSSGRTKTAVFFLNALI